LTATGSTGWDNDARRDRVRVGFAMASLMCLPVVVCNLGVEMLYILEQRLRAQSVPEEKAVKVLHDVVTAMFDPAFVDELFKPQPAYTQRSMRRIMDKLAHSSIMRLSESSMDKLYDLVTMGLKYQLVTCREPEEILTVTLFHLATLKSYLTDPKVMSMIDAVEAELRVTYAGFPKAGWHALRQTLFRFLADKQIKVSLFLQENLQNDDGRVKLPAPIVSARALGPVGTVTRHDGTSGARETTRLDVRFDVKSTPPHRVPPGGNMYAMDRQAEPPAPFAAASAVSSGRDTARDRGGDGGAPPRVATGVSRPKASSSSSAATSKGAAEELMANAGRGAATELDALAGLIRNAAPVDAFKLTLFGGDDGGEGGASAGGGGFGGGRSRVIEFKGDAGNQASGLTEVMRSFKIDKTPPGKRAPPPPDDDEDDLLALMDGA